MAANKGSHHPIQTQAGLLPPNFIHNTSAISSSLRKCELRDCLCLLASGFKPTGPTEFLANLITKGSLLTKVGLLRRECGRGKELMAEEVQETPGCVCERRRAQQPGLLVRVFRVCVPSVGLVKGITPSPRFCLAHST